MAIILPIGYSLLGKAASGRRPPAGGLRSPEPRCREGGPRHASHQRRHLAQAHECTQRVRQGSSIAKNMANPL